MRGRVGGAWLCASLALACGSGDPEPSGAPLAREQRAAPVERGENGTPTVEQLVLHPPRPLPGQRVEARIEVSDPEGDPVRLELEWRLDGRTVLVGTQSSVAPDGMRKGQRLEVAVTATDGRDTSAPRVAAVEVGNQPPLVQALYFAPDGEIAPGDEVTAAPQALDPDGDELEYTYQWVLNGKVVRGADEAGFDTSKLKRGDRLQARVMVSDGEAESPFAETMTLELANRAPRFAGLPEITASEGTFRATLVAEDPDGDRSLRYRVLKGPEGLALDPVSGQLHWRPNPEAAGTHAVEVAVADGHGAESALGFELTVASHDAKVAPPAKAAADADAEAGEESDE